MAGQCCNVPHLLQNQHSCQVPQAVSKGGPACPVRLPAWLLLPGGPPFTLPPPPAPPVQATVFALYDEARTLQYVGFSKGLRDTLRTLFSRRPEKTHYFK